MKCSICGMQIKDVRGWNGGNNAMPVNEGRCCDTCNTEVVMPRRIADMCSRKEQPLTPKEQQAIVRALREVKRC